MSAKQFDEFIRYIREELGWSQAELARKLECGKNQITFWKAKGCPHYIALACSALVCKLPPLYMP